MTEIELKSKIAVYKKEIEFATIMATEAYGNNDINDVAVYTAIADCLSLLVGQLEHILNFRP